MKRVGLVIALLGGAAGSAPAQLARPQATEQVLILPLQAAAADSALGIAVADMVRDRIAQLAKYRVIVIPKDKLCEALRASGFPCDGLLDDQQARQLARFLQVEAYVTGRLERRRDTLVARVRSIDISSSGMAASFTVNNGNPGSPQALAEAIVQRLNTMIRAGEHARECNQLRQRGQFARALAAARKAFTIDPRAAGAHLCVATVYEAQRMPVDSMIAASQRALPGDTFNTTAWENIARGYQQKGDTLRAIDAFIHQLAGDPRNTAKRMAVAQLLRQMKQYQRAAELLDDGIAVVPETQMIEFKERVCIEGQLWRCVLETIDRKVRADSSALADSLLVKTVIAAAEQVADTQAQLRYAGLAARRFSRSVYFWNKLGAAYELAGRPDSAVVAYKQSFALDSTNLGVALLTAKATVDAAMWDTAAANRLRADTVALGQLRRAFAGRIDESLPYLHRVLVTGDSAQRLNASVIMLTGGSKLAQAAVYDRAYAWLDTLLLVVAPRSPADSSGPRHQIRVNGSFWYGLSSVLTLSQPYQIMVRSKSCSLAKEMHDRLARTRAALQLGRRVHGPTVEQMLGFLRRYEEQMPAVKASFKCRNF